MPVDTIRIVGFRVVIGFAIKQLDLSLLPDKEKKRDGDNPDKIG
jgi:hypothetical protein